MYFSSNADNSFRNGASGSGNMSVWFVILYNGGNLAVVLVWWFGELKTTKLKFSGRRNVVVATPEMPN